MSNAQRYSLLAEQLAETGVDIEAAKSALKQQRIETPSWGYANSGTRFKVYPWPGAARSVPEKLDDAALVHSLCGIAPTVAIHIPWDRPADDDYAGMRQYAESKGIAIGAVNPNVFQSEDYRLGSLGNPSAGIREAALDHIIECCEIMPRVNSDILSLWFADGTNYAGQDDLRARKRRFEQGLGVAYGRLPAGARMMIEYKFFEPAFYSTDVADWGMALLMALKLGPQAQVLVDLGHHAQGVNIEQIVAALLDEGRLGGFHFNNRKYADDDLIVGSVNPYELFLIYNELVAAGDSARDVAYMIDQSHNIEGKIGPMLQSVLNCQEALAKALIVPRPRLAAAQAAGDVLQAHRLLTDAFRADVRPLLIAVREEMGVPADPIAAYRDGNYEGQRAETRGSQLGSGGYAV